MQRIFDTTAAAALPAVPTLAGAPGFFTEGVPGIAPATIVRGWWMNMVQEELLSLLTAAGITPDSTGTNFTQVLAAIRALTGPGRLLGVRVFTGSSTYIPTPGMTTAIVEVQGGGSAGSGAAATGAGQVCLGSPGLSGSYGRSRFSAATIGSSQVITIGAGGTAAAGAVGGAGGSSSFGALLTAPGGTVGSFTGPGTPPFSVGGGYSSAATGFNELAVQGTVGAVALAVSTTIAFGGTGGASQFGPGAPAIASGNPGIAALNYGAGGGSAAATQSTAALAGGAGKSGLILVWEYS